MAIFASDTVFDHLRTSGFDAWLSQVHGPTYYAALVLCLLAGLFGFPLPEDLVLIAAGALLERGHGGLTGVFFVCYVSILLGDLAAYGWGRLMGMAIMSRPLFTKWVSSERLDRIRADLKNRYFMLIVISRCVIIMRSVVFPLSGALKLRVWKFIAADMAAVLLSVSGMLAIGYYGSANIETIKSVVDSARMYLLVGLVCASCLYFLKRRINRRT